MKQTHQQIVSDLEQVYRMFKPPATLDQIKNIARYSTVTRRGKTISLVQYADGSVGSIRNSRLADVEVVTDGA